MSAGLRVPRQVVSHGWWLRDARKMSKSVGNVVRPDELVAAFGVDALRWHLVAAMSFGQDASFSDEDFLAGYNADLANGLGNTLSRAVKMSRDFFGGKTPAEMSDDEEVLRMAARRRRPSVSRWRAAFEGYRLQEAAGEIRALLETIDGYITTNEPWRARPDDSVEELSDFRSRILYRLPRGAARRGRACSPRSRRARPTEVLRRLGIDRRAEDLRASDLAWGQLPLNAPLPSAPPLFPTGGRERIFCFQRRRRRWRFEGELCGRRRKRRFLRRCVSGRCRGERRGSGPAAAPSPAPSPDAPRRQPTPPSESKISIDDFMKIDLRVGEVIAAEKVEKSKKLMKMTVKLGEEVRTIVGGIATAYTAEQLVGRKFVFVANLAPAKLMGIESNGMILAATLPETGEPSLLMVDPSVPSGAKVK